MEFYRTALDLHDNCGATARAAIAALNLSICLVVAGHTLDAREEVVRRLRTMIGLGHEQHVAAAKLVLLVCDAKESRWTDWLDRFEAVSVALAESGQVHEDLAMLAETACSAADTAQRSDEAAVARRLATEQRTRLHPA